MLQQPGRRRFSSRRLTCCCQVVLQWSPGQNWRWPLPRVGVHSGMGSNPFRDSTLPLRPSAAACTRQSTICYQPRTWHEVNRVSAPIMPCRAQLEVGLHVAQHQRAEWQYDDQ